MLFLQLINYFQKLNRILLSTFNIYFKLPRLYGIHWNQYLNIDNMDFIARFYIFWITED